MFPNKGGSEGSKGVPEQQDVSHSRKQNDSTAILGGKTLYTPPFANLDRFDQHCNLSKQLS
jgi:hypothetical protein